MIKTEFIKLYENLNELWESSTLQESNYIKTLEKAYETNPDDLCNITSLRATTAKFEFLLDKAFDPYFAYLEEIFKRNGNCRYVINKRNSDQKPDAHHIIFKSLGGSNEATNLIALFRVEHLEAHTRFAEGMLNYYKKATNDRDFLETVLANAIGSVNILNKYEQGRLSKEKLIYKLTDLLGTAISDEEDLNYDTVDDIVSQINSLNKGLMTAAVNRVNHSGAANLKPPKGNTYIVSFLDGTSETAVGTNGVRALVYEHNVNTEYESNIDRFQIDSLTTTPSKETPFAARTKFERFGLVYPNGIYKTMDTKERRKAKPIIYFPVLKKENDTLAIDYSNGKWTQSPNSLRRSKIGLPDDAYQRLDKIHNDLVNKISPYRTFKSLKSGDDENRENYIFMYADDIELLQEIIDIENKKRTEEDQIIIRVTQDGQPWYIDRQRIENKKRA